jgi:hypothetical protein
MLHTSQLLLAELTEATVEVWQRLCTVCCSVWSLIPLKRHGCCQALHVLSYLAGQHQVFCCVPEKAL